MKSPGAMDITRMPNGAKSLAMGSVIPTTPPFDAAYATCLERRAYNKMSKDKFGKVMLQTTFYTHPTCPSYADTLAVFIIHPLNPLSSSDRLVIRSDANRATLNDPIVFTVIVFVNSSNECNLLVIVPSSLTF